MSFEVIDEPDNTPDEKVSSVEVLREIVNLKANGETRIQQEELVEAIEAAINDKDHIIVEGPTGAGKSMAYLLPVLVSEKRAIISTATKQLSEQLNETEMPFIQKSLLKTHPNFAANDYALLKGRDNYYCYRKADIQADLNKKAESQSGAQLSMFDGLSERAKEASKELHLIDDWAENTRTGDRSEAPVVSDETWRNYSSTSTECPGRKICPFGEKCFAEMARDRAKEAQIVITNHALVANDLSSEDGVMLGDRDLVVFDELHELESYLSSAWSATLTTKMLSDYTKELKKSKEVNDSDITVMEKAIKTLDIELEKVENGGIETLPLLIENALKTLNTKFLLIGANLNAKLQNKVTSNQKKETLSFLSKRLTELNDAIVQLLDNDLKTVRSFKVPEEVKFQKRGTPKVERVITMKAEPLLVGPKLQGLLNERDMTMVGASATVRVTGGFEIPLHNLGLDTLNNKKSLAVTSPFDYPNQAILHIPDKEFPSPSGKERKEHSLAVKDRALELVKASGGRALVLTTTTFDAKDIAEFLRTELKKSKLPMKVLAQGDAPQKQLVADFAADETSILVATMGLWHGLDIQGPSLSLVVITKIPFKPSDDPLLSARQKYAESKGRNGFMDVYVADANVMLSQGIGRLIRHTTDKGVVAVLDNRLLFSRYGKKMMESFPNMKIFTNITIVVNALKRLTGNADK